MESVRIDRWLCAARLYKTRSLSQQACTGGLVTLNGAAVRPSHLVRAGDEVRAEAPRGLVVWQVKSLADKRLSAALAPTTETECLREWASRTLIYTASARSI